MALPSRTTACCSASGRMARVPRPVSGTSSAAGRSRVGTAPQSRGSPCPDPDLTVLESHRLAAPPLPCEVFGEWWSDWIRDQAEVKSCPPDYVALGLLSSAGTLLGNARWGSPWFGWVEPPLLWTASVGMPSSGKSPGLEVFTNHNGHPARDRGRRRPRLPRAGQSVEDRGHARQDQARSVGGGLQGGAQGLRRARRRSPPGRRNRSGRRCPAPDA